MTRSRAVFGVVLAGGVSRRFGRPKARAEIDGSSLAERSVGTLQSAGLPVGMVTADEDLAKSLGVPSRRDIEAGLGPLGGLWTALEWAEERRETAVFLLGCDMPLVTSDLVRLVMDRSGPAVAAAPMGPGGVQPLCALYTLACLPEVRKRALSEDRSLHGLLYAVEAVEIGEGEVGSVSDPATVFWNVNTEADGVRAAELLSSTLGGGR